MVGIEEVTNVKEAREAFSNLTREQFYRDGLIIAQDDDEDYDESGYVVIRMGENAVIAHYGHCSCYDTWDDLIGGEWGIPCGFHWFGSLDELKVMAEEVKDPMVPDRVAEEGDFDYDHLFKVYDQVRAWFDRKGPAK